MTELNPQAAVLFISAPQHLLWTLKFYTSFVTNRKSHVIEKNE